MNGEQRITLDKLIKQYDCEDTTKLVRKLKHSTKIRECINDLVKLKANTPSYEEFKRQSLSVATFLYDNYTNIFNWFVDGQLNLEIMDKFLVMLSKIENGELDQHEASYNIGMLLKDIYIDNRINVGDLEEEDDEDKYIQPKHDVSWKEYKSQLASSSN